MHISNRSVIVCYNIIQCRVFNIVIGIVVLIYKYPFSVYFIEIYNLPSPPAYSDHPFYLILPNVPTPF